MAVLCGVALCGCTTREVIKPAAETTLFVTRSSDKVSLQWQSQPGAFYTVIFADTLGAGARWQPLPQASRLRGTGQLMQVQDQPPLRRQRFYDIQVEYPK